MTVRFDGHGAGTIIGVDTQSGIRWHAEALRDGTLRGRDLDGADWSFDPATRLYTNAKTGRACAETSVLHVCPA